MTVHVRPEKDQQQRPLQQQGPPIHPPARHALYLRILSPLSLRLRRSGKDGGQNCSSRNSSSRRRRRQVAAAPTSSAPSTSAASLAIAPPAAPTTATATTASSSTSGFVSSSASSPGPSVPAPAKRRREHTFLNFLCCSRPSTVRVRVVERGAGSLPPTENLAQTRSPRSASSHLAAIPMATTMAPARGAPIRPVSPASATTATSSTVATEFARVTGPAAGAGSGNAGNGAAATRPLPHSHSHALAQQAALQQHLAAEEAARRAEVQAQMDSEKRTGNLFAPEEEAALSFEALRLAPPCRQVGKLIIEDFDVIKTVGTGTFARVMLAKPALSMPTMLGVIPDPGPAGGDPDKNNNTGAAANTAAVGQPAAPATGAVIENPVKHDRVYAIKTLRKAEVVRLKQIDHVRQERDILKDVAGHPFITNFVTSFSDRESLYIVLDFVPGGELFTHLRRLRTFDEDTARFYAAEIVLVLEFLHEQQGWVAYRDLKPENLLLDRDGHIKLVDFGFAKRLGHEATETYTLCGTPEYLAPEVIKNKGHDTAVDWWALGVLIYEFLTGVPPFWSSSPLDVYKMILQRPILFPARPIVSEIAKDVIRAFCTIDRSQRLGNIAGGVARVKAHPFFAGIDWDALLQRRVRGPIIPPVSSPDDTQCFDTYSENPDGQRQLSNELRRRFDHCFADF